MTEVEEKREHLKALDAFIASPAHLAYVAAVQEEIRMNERAIVAIVPDNQKDFVEECQLKGELRYMEQCLTRFEDARVSLNNRIDEMVEAELENATEQKR